MMKKWLIGIFKALCGAIAGIVVGGLLTDIALELFFSGVKSKNDSEAIARFAAGVVYILIGASIGGIIGAVCAVIFPRPEKEPFEE